MIDRFYGNIAKLSNDVYIAFRIRDLSQPMNRRRCRQPMRAVDLDNSAQSTSLVSCVYSSISSSSSFPRPQRVKTISTVRRRAIPNKALFVVVDLFFVFVMRSIGSIDWSCTFLLSFIALFVELLLFFLRAYFQTTQNNEE
jgi:hypothetical protein